LEIQDWMSTAKNETKILAEMVKGLALISQSEKQKVDNLTKFFQKEIDRMKIRVDQSYRKQNETLETLQTELQNIQMVNNTFFTENKD